ncbi:DUF2786 domain-containing protein [Mycolicibacterium sp.]|uniref:DUF2786 domain-containing protein n=1 Tax=Mycolicibacterium sp. TaxID=2320850 RepID=UPI00355D53B4
MSSRSIETLTDKVAKLLNQAENAGTEAESATFMSKAQELATLHSIDLAKARHATVAKQRTTPTQRTITLGVRGTRGLNTLVSLFSGIASANDVTIDIASDSTRVYAYGFAEDIDIAEAMFTSLSVQMAQAAQAYHRSGDWKRHEVYVPGRSRGWEWIEGHYKAPSWLSVRLDFQQGFAAQVGRRLALARAEAESAAQDADDAQDADSGTALVLVAKRESVGDFYRSRSNARGSYRGRRQVSSSAAQGAGHRAGDKARLSQATELGGARKALA